jgi:hypothetical protein
MTDRALLDRLCRCYGIAPEYTDIWGRSHPTSAETQRALLAAMDVPAETKADLEHALADYERRAWGNVLAPVQVVQEETEGPFKISLTVPKSVWPAYGRVSGVVLAICQPRGSPRCGPGNGPTVWDGSAGQPQGTGRDGQSGTVPGQVGAQKI